MVSWIPGPDSLMSSECGTMVDLVSYFHSDLKKTMIVVLTVVMTVIILIIIIAVFIEQFP